MVFALLLAPAAWVAGEALLDPLGPEPAKAALKEIGLWTIRLLLVTLAVTPVGRILAAPQVLSLRRMLGLATLGYALLHLVLYAADEKFHPAAHRLRDRAAILPDHRLRRAARAGGARLDLDRWLDAEARQAVEAAA